MAGTRLVGIGLATGLLLLASGCAEAAPSSLQSSVSPSPTDAPATPPLPTPPLQGVAEVVVAVDSARIAYAVEGCPLTAWLDDTIADDISFGAYPEYLTADDGTRWSTHMVVLTISDGSVTDWSFRLTSPLSGIPGDAERSLISQPDPDIEIELAITSSEAIFTTGFFDSETAGDVLRRFTGTVSVTCR